MKYDENRPIYQQIVEQIEYWIISNHWQQDQKIPSVRQLAEELEVNPTTIQRAYSILEQEGILTSQRGIGKFVTNKATKITDLRLRLIEAQVELFITQLRKLRLTQQETEQIIVEIERVGNE